MLSQWRTKSYERKCKMAAECLYWIWVGIPDENMAELCRDLSGHFAMCATIPDYLGGKEEWESIVDKCIDWIEKSIESTEKDRNGQILSEG